MTFNPALAGIGVLGTSAVVAGGVAVNGAFSEDADIEESIKASQNPELRIEADEPHNWYVLVDDKKYERDSTHKDKYGRKFEMSFIGVDNRIVYNWKLNDHWWKWAYKHSYSLEATHGFSRSIISSWSKLKDACREAYKGTLDESTGLITSGSSKYKEEDVWKFCSGIHRKPTPIGNNEVYAENTIGAKNRSKLISTKGKENDALWDTRTFYILRNDQKSIESTYAFFKKRYDRDKSGWKSGHKPLAAKEWCEEAYNKIAQNSSTDDTPTEDEVLKYCSIEDKYYDPVNPSRQ